MATINLGTITPPTVPDQAYDPLSTRAQSGVSVAQALTEVDGNGVVLQLDSNRTDNQVIINQSLIDYEGTGKQLLIAGKYTCDGPVEARSGVSICGLPGMSKYSCELHFNYWHIPDESTAVGYIHSPATIAPDGAILSNFKLKNITLSSDYTGGPLIETTDWLTANPGRKLTTGAIRLRRVQSLEIENVVIKQTVIAATIIDVDGAHLERIECVGLAKGGIQIYGRGAAARASAGHTQNIIVRDLHGYNTGDDLLGVHSDLSVDEGFNGVYATVSTAAGSNIITGTNFDASMVGKTIDIKGAGTEGAPIRSTIASYVSTTEITITAQCATAISDTTARIDHSLIRNLYVGNVRNKTANQYTPARTVSIDGLEDSVIENIDGNGTAGASLYVQGSRINEDVVWSKNITAKNIFGKNIGMLANDVISTRPHCIMIWGCSDSSFECSANDIKGIPFALRGCVDIALNVRGTEYNGTGVQIASGPAGPVGQIIISGRLKGAGVSASGVAGVDQSALVVTPY